MIIANSHFSIFHCQVSSRPLDLYFCTSAWILFYSFKCWQKFTPTITGTETWLDYQFTPLRNIHTLFTLREAFTQVRIFFEVCHFNLGPKTSSEDFQSHWHVKVKVPWRSPPLESQWGIFRLVMSSSSLLLWLRFREYSFDELHFYSEKPQQSLGQESLLIANTQLIGKPSWWLVRVTLVVDWLFLPQNFGPMVGTYEGLLRLCECTLGGGSIFRTPHHYRW